MSFWLSQAAASGTLMPPEGTAIAKDVTHLYIFMLVVSTVVFVLLMGAMLIFVVKYRRKSDTAKSAYITHNSVLEFLWSFIPLCVFLFIFGWGWMIFHKMRTFPHHAMEVDVIAHQWGWQFEYMNGKKSANLHVPIGKPVKLIMTSLDVIHDLYIPAFRIKQDVVPGRYTAEWFNVIHPGNYQIFCTQYCGVGHSAMLAKVIARPEKEFDHWLAGNEMQGLTLAQQGQKLFNTVGCVGCHTVDGTPRIGPTLKGVFGSTVPLEGGQSVKADDAYIRESIMKPQAKIVRGFTTVLMPTFQLSASEVNALVAYVKSVK